MHNTRLKHNALCLALAAANFMGAAFLLHFVYNAIKTKSVPGKLHAVYYAPDYHYYLHVGICIVAIGFFFHNFRVIRRWYKEGLEGN